MKTTSDKMRCPHCDSEMEYLRSPAYDGFYWDCIECKDAAILEILFGVVPTKENPSDS